MKSAILDREQAKTAVSGEPAMLVVYICWDCERLALDTGRNASHGPYCECGERMEARNIIG